MLILFLYMAFFRIKLIFTPLWSSDVMVSFIPSCATAKKKSWTKKPPPTLSKIFSKLLITCIWTKFSTGTLSPKTSFSSWYFTYNVGKCQNMWFWMGCQQTPQCLVEGNHLRDPSLFIARTAEREQIRWKSWHLGNWNFSVLVDGGLLSIWDSRGGGSSQDSKK